MKKMYSFLIVGILAISSLPINSSYAVQTNEELWDKFIKYDLCITDYDSLTDEEKELCKFIFETEQSSTGTVRCERARRTLAHDENIGERVTLEQLEDCYEIWDRYSYSKAGDSWYIGAGAFAGDELCYSGAKSITIPSNVEVIGALPYKRGEGATSGIEVPPIRPLTDVQPCALDSDCTINGWYGTEAHFYALENNLKFNPMDDLLFGDANNDSKIGIADAVTLQEYLLKNSEIGYEADLNKDGRIDSFDMITMRNMLINN